MPRTPAKRFGIGEWYGRSFVRLTEGERRELAAIAKMPTSNAPPCPFLSTSQHCPKKGGICSLRLYEQTPDGDAAPVEGEEGSLRVMCPHRFKQAETIYREIGQAMLGTPNPKIVAEIRFLRRNDDVGEREPSAKVAASEDVGNIDNVLVHPDEGDLEWCALEIQAVYFSGRKMPLLIDHIGDNPRSGLPFPDSVRRPDYRSSGPKRLMPQLQIKVPTLRRWGKKMAIVVDVPWFRANVVGVPTVNDISNCDIAWFLVSFDESTDPATLTVGSPKLQTLERAVEGLTGGYPVTLAEFEAKIQDKLNPPRPRGRRARSAPNQDSDQ